jgi:hypothetical protein
LTRQFIQNHFSTRDLLPHDVIGLLDQIEMVPGVIAYFVVVFGNRCGAIAILLRPISSDEEGAVNVRFFESGD